MLLVSHTGDDSGKKDKEVKEVEPEADAEESGPSYEELAARVSAISKPLASKKLTKKIYKVGVAGV